MCSQSVELAGICTASAVCRTTQTVAWAGRQKFRHWRDGAIVSANGFTGPRRPVGIQADGLQQCELDAKPIAVHQQLSRYDLHETEAAHHVP
jgi:hypothetical protein